jgi:hypothetical protein
MGDPSSGVTHSASILFSITLWASTWSSPAFGVLVVGYEPSISLEGHGKRIMWPGVWSQLGVYVFWREDESSISPTGWLQWQ